MIYFVMQLGAFFIPIFNASYFLSSKAIRVLNSFILDLLNFFKLVSSNKSTNIVSICFYRVNLFFRDAQSHI